MKGKNVVSYLLNQPGMTESRTIDLVRRVKRLKEIPRDKPPVKGAFVKYMDKVGQDKLLSWTMHVKKEVLRELEKRSGIDKR